MKNTEELICLIYIKFWNRFLKFRRNLKVIQTIPFHLIYDLYNFSMIEGNILEPLEWETRILLLLNGVN